MGGLILVSLVETVRGFNRWIAAYKSSLYDVLALFIPFIVALEKASVQSETFFGGGADPLDSYGIDFSLAHDVAQCFL